MADHVSTAGETVTTYETRLEALRLAVQLASVGIFDSIGHRLDAALGAAKVFEAMLTPVGAAPAEASDEKAAEDHLEEILNGDGGA